MRVFSCIVTPTVGSDAGKQIPAFLLDVAYNATAGKFVLFLVRNDTGETRVVEHDKISNLQIIGTRERG